VLAKEFPKIYFDELRNQGIALPEGVENSLEVQAQFASAIMKLSEVESVILDPNFNASYYSALDKLACDYPVLAFRVRGHEKLQLYMESASSYFKEVSKLVSEDGELEGHIDLLQSLATDANDEVSSDLTKTIDENLRSLAWRCGLLTWISTCRRIRRNFNPKITNKDKAEIKVMIYPLVEGIKEEMRNEATEQ
jgi:uncharacterized Zn finger protein